jgi:5'-methylthioadenosine nucleosidase
MEAEAQPIVEELKLEKDSPSLVAEPAPTITFSGEVDGVTVYLACNGKHFSSNLD